MCAFLEGFGLMTLVALCMFACLGALAAGLLAWAFIRAFMEGLFT